MARRATISTREILQVARTLFLERGGEVPTAVIARRAGVSEGSIFRRFPTKKALFHAAMGLDEDPPWIQFMHQLPGKDLRAELVELALQIIEFARETVPRMVLLRSMRGLGSPAEILSREDGPHCRAVAALTDFVDQAMRKGQMRAAHPEIVARVLLGSMFNYAFFETMGIQVRGPLDSRTYARGVVDALWQGLTPQAGGKSQ